MCTNLVSKAHYKRYSVLLDIWYCYPFYINNCQLKSWGRIFKRNAKKLKFSKYRKVRWERLDHFYFNFTHCLTISSYLFMPDLWWPEGVVKSDSCFYKKPLRLSIKSGSPGEPMSVFKSPLFCYVIITKMRWKWKNPII